MQKPRSQIQVLREVFEEQITVRYVAVCNGFLETCQTADTIDKAVACMEINNFDIIPIRDETGDIVGYVTRGEEATGDCSKVMQAFKADDLVSESTPILDLLEIMRKKPRMFVLHGNRVIGLVTRGDLQKAPVRMLLFEQMMLLEMQMLRLIRKKFAEGGWDTHLSEKRVADAERLLKTRRQRNDEIDLLDCIQFCDKRDIVLGDSFLREALGFHSVQEGKKLLKAAQKLRDNLAHGQDFFVNSSWEDTVDLVNRIERVVSRCEKIDM